MSVSLLIIMGGLLGLSSTLTYALWPIAAASEDEKPFDGDGNRISRASQEFNDFMEWLEREKQRL